MMESGILEVPKSPIQSRAAASFILYHLEELMERSPFSPPEAELVSKENLPLQEMNSFTNEQLREKLANPEVYTPETVHKAAIELSLRHAVPRYYTRISSRLQRDPITVQRTWNIDLITKVHILFSENQLKRYCLIIAILETIYLFIRVISFVNYIKLTTYEYFTKHAIYYITTSLGILLSVFVLLFWITLYRTLSIRTIKG